MKRIIVLTLSLLLSSLSYSALTIRDLDGDWSNGHEAVYDDVLDITWLADASSMGSSGFGADFLAGVPQGSKDSDTASVSINTASWFINTMNGYNSGSGYLGVNSWRLPHFAAVGGGYAEGELSYNYHINLGGVDCFGNTAGCLDQAGLDNQSLFQNLDFYHWTDAEQFHVPDHGCPCTITQQGENQTIAFSVQSFYNVWAVADGEFGSPVPIPASAFMFGSSLIGILLARRKNK